MVLFVALNFVSTLKCNNNFTLVYLRKSTYTNVIYVYNRFRLVFALVVLGVALPNCYAVSVDGTTATSLQGLPPTVVTHPSSVVPVSRVIEPVMFSAVRASEKTRKSVSRVGFDITLTDIGFGWNPSRSEFVCFYPGSYFFSFAALSDSTSSFKSVYYRFFVSLQYSNT